MLRTHVVYQSNQNSPAVTWIEPARYVSQPCRYHYETLGLEPDPCSRIAASLGVASSRTAHRCHERIQACPKHDVNVHIVFDGHRGLVTGSLLVGAEVSLDSTCSRASVSSSKVEGSGQYSGRLLHDQQYCSPAFPAQPELQSSSAEAIPATRPSISLTTGRLPEHVQWFALCPELAGTRTRSSRRNRPHVLNVLLAKDRIEEHPGPHMHMPPPDADTEHSNTRRANRTANDRDAYGYSDHCRRRGACKLGNHARATSPKHCEL